MIITLTAWEQFMAEPAFALEPVKDSEGSKFYWLTDIVTTEVSAAYFGGVHSSRISYMAGPAKIIGSCCKDCAGPVYVFSRSEITDAFRNRRHGCSDKTFDICRECVAKRTAERNAPFEAAWRAREARERELASMPYREYLQTDEWKNTRTAAIKRARGCCQTCASSSDRLNVHHRTYARRGREYSSDLIVLCEPCHKLFHDHGKLADGGRAAA